MLLDVPCCWCGCASGAADVAVAAVAAAAGAGSLRVLLVGMTATIFGLVGRTVVPLAECAEVRCFWRGGALEAEDGRDGRGALERPRREGKGGEEEAAAAGADSSIASSSSLGSSSSPGDRRLFLARSRLCFCTSFAFCSAAARAAAASFSSLCCVRRRFEVRSGVSPVGEVALVDFLRPVALGARGGAADEAEATERAWPSAPFRKPTAHASASR